MGSIRKLAGRMVVVAALGTVFAVSATPTFAYSRSNWGYAGAVQTPRIVGTTLDSVTGTVFFPVRTIWKSAHYGAYNQRVCITYDVVYASAWASTQWQDYASTRTCGWITTTSARAFPGARFTVNGGWFIYSGNVTVQWYLSNGRLIGQSTFDYNVPGDYSCNCTIASSYSLGAYLLL